MSKQSLSTQLAKQAQAVNRFQMIGKQKADFSNLLHVETPVHINAIEFKEGKQDGRDTVYVAFTIVEMPDHYYNGNAILRELFEKMQKIAGYTEEEINTLLDADPLQVSFEAKKSASKRTYTDVQVVE